MMRGRLAAILSQRCPVCLKGRMFRGMFTMNDTCDVCGHRFMREQGFFQGSMYLSYLIGLVVFLVLGWSAALWLAPRWGTGPALTAAILVQMLFVPWMWREARVIWAHVNVGTTS